MDKFVRAPKRTGMPWRSFAVAALIIALAVVAQVTGVVRLHIFVFTSAQQTLTPTTQAPSHLAPKPLTPPPLTPTAHDPIAAELPTATEQQQFDQAEIELANMMWSSGEPLNQLVLETQSACSWLDGSVALLAATRALCAPTIEVTKLRYASVGRCTHLLAPVCERIWARIAGTLKQLAAAKHGYWTAVATISDGDCREALVSAPEATLSTYDTVADDARHVRVELQRHDAAQVQPWLVAFQNDQLPLNASASAPQAHIDAIRAACLQPRTHPLPRAAAPLSIVPPFPASGSGPAPGSGGTGASARPSAGNPA